MLNGRYNGKRKLMEEFLRYLLVGGTAFLVDFFTVFACEELLFHHLRWETVYLSTAVGFIAGLIYNYVLSIFFVFEDASKKIEGRKGTSFLLFAVIGLIGLGLTEAGMYFGVKVFGIHYLLTKTVVAGVVLFWNYIARKVMIFR